MSESCGSMQAGILVVLGEDEECTSDSAESSFGSSTSNAIGSHRLRLLRSHAEHLIDWGVSRCRRIVVCIDGTISTKHKGSAL